MEALGLKRTCRTSSNGRQWILGSSYIYLEPFTMPGFLSYLYQKLTDFDIGYCT